MGYQVISVNATKSAPVNHMCRVHKAAGLANKKRSQHRRPGTRRHGAIWIDAEL